MNADDVEALERQHVGLGRHLGHRRQYNKRTGVKPPAFGTIGSLFGCSECVARAFGEI